MQPALSQASASELGNFFRINWPMRPPYYVGTEKEGAPLNSLSPLPWLFLKAKQTPDTRELFLLHGHQPSLSEGFLLYFYKIFFLTRDALWLKSPWLMPTCLHSNNTKPLNYGLSYGRSSREEEKSVCPSLTIQQNAGS